MDLVVGEILVDGDAEDGAGEFDGDRGGCFLVCEVAERGLLGQGFGVVDGGGDAFLIECFAELVSCAVEGIEVDPAGVEVPRGVGALGGDGAVDALDGVDA